MNLPFRPAPQGLPKLPVLPYRKPVEGRDYWVQDDFLPDPMAVVERAWAREDWIHGAPYTKEPWPGMRALNALNEPELALVEDWTKRMTGSKKLWTAPVPEGATPNHNCFQIVGQGESGPRPHSDSRKLCRFASVIYLSPKAPRSAGTSFFRQRLPGGRLGGNYVPAPHANLPEALGTRFVPLEAWEEDFAIENVFNRIVLYRAEFVHSASAYFGRDLRTKRMTSVFFWMAS